MIEISEIHRTIEHRAMSGEVWTELRRKLAKQLFLKSYSFRSKVVASSAKAK